MKLLVAELTDVKNDTPNRVEITLEKGGKSKGAGFSWTKEDQAAWDEYLKTSGTSGSKEDWADYLASSGTVSGKEGADKESK